MGVVIAAPLSHLITIEAADIYDKRIVNQKPFVLDMF